MMKQETTMNEIEIRDILCEYVGRRKAVKIAQMIYKEMEKETKHIHNGRNFFVREDENGKLVLTMKSKIEDSVKWILVKNLETHKDVDECFMLIMKKSILTEKNLTRGIETIRVEGSDSCIYNELFNNRGMNPRIDQFLDKLCKALSAKVQRFEVPVYDVSIDDDGKPRFIPGRIPTRKLSFNEWKQLAEKNNLTLGNKNQYVLFLATMIERMKVKGWTQDEAMQEVCNDSTALGHYSNTKYSQYTLEPTGSRSIAGKCDLANVRKILVADETYSKACSASGSYTVAGDKEPLADIRNVNNAEKIYYGVGWFVF